jgi:hypothetical protein
MGYGIKLIETIVIPELYATEHIAMEDKRALVKLYSPVINWEWYIIESDGKDLCFGLVKGYETEFGYFSIKELAGIRTVDGYAVKQDLVFKPCNVAELLK